MYSSSAERDEDDLSDSDLDVDNSSDDSSDVFDWDEGYGYESDSSDYNVCVVMWNRNEMRDALRISAID